MQIITNLFGGLKISDFSAILQGVSILLAADQNENT